MTSFNQAILIGNLGRNPESKSANFATVNLAVNESWKDESGNKKTRTSWFTILLNGYLAKFASEYLSKGSLVLVKGRLRENEWIDEAGNAHKSIQIHAQEIIPLNHVDLKTEEIEKPQTTPVTVKRNYYKK